MAAVVLEVWLFSIDLMEQVRVFREMTSSMNSMLGPTFQQKFSMFQVSRWCFQSPVSQLAPVSQPILAGVCPPAVSQNDLNQRPQRTLRQKIGDVMKPERGLISIFLNASTVPINCMATRSVAVVFVFL